VDRDGFAVLAAAQEFFDAGDSPGLAVSVLDSGKVLCSGAWGYAIPEKDVLVTEATLFGAGSISKQCLAACALIVLREQNRSLNDPLASYFAPASVLNPSLTLRHLLSHTAGLGRHVDIQLASDPLMRTELLELVASLAKSSDAIEPGREWCYCNAGYALVGRILESLCEQELAEILRLRVLEPCRLEEYALTLDDSQLRGAAVGHIPHDIGFRSVDRPSNSAAFGSGALLISARDLARWGDRLWLQGALGFTVPSMMAEPQALADGTTLPYGLGVYLGEFAGGREYSHDGNSGGFSAQLAVYPSHGLSIAVVANSSRHSAEVLEQRIARLLHGVPEPAAIEADPAIAYATPFAGTYRRQGEATTVIAVAGNLSITTPGGRKAKLIPLAFGRFVEEQDPTTEYLFSREKNRLLLEVRRFGKLLAILKGDGERTDK
jgi:CubicO group peptidase (beta-lactamase class C family)